LAFPPPGASASFLAPLVGARRSISMQSAGDDPYYRATAALIASTIKAAREIVQPCSHDTKVSASRVIACLGGPELGTVI
jgi:hypothetical protein